MAVKKKRGKVNNGNQENHGDIEEGQGNFPDESLSLRDKLLAEEKAIIGELKRNTPYDVIAKKYHRSPKQISDIKKNELKKENQNQEEGGEASGRMNEALAGGKQLENKKRPYEKYGDLGPRWAGHTEGQIQAECYKMFEKDKKPYAVTRDLELPQPLVQEVFQQFLEAAGHVSAYCKLSYQQGEIHGKNFTNRDSYILKYPCKVCGEPMRFDPSDPNDRKNLIRMLKEGGIQTWAHTACLKENDEVDA